ncbi:FIST domain protein [Pseudogulbenkiania sp. NH8B]|uniref:nitric oxide-sensing protein NosP n=1 Tax=Pseudogulbenkiania sp. (strain NH8B) TaxID=748280 RepID=UPI0002279F55|nr:nitric oxide-sensing protein NosP [Pseudogulbenkiania sp. NH8B]BAK76699.1 FIST domain protein [Pseudogulbenkiania sp. NH8B]
MSIPNTIRTAQSRAGDARAAVREFYAGVCQPGMALVVFFCSSDYDLDTLADEMTKLFQGVTVVGCTAAGEIGPVGYHDLGLTGASFPAASCTAVSGRIGDLQHFQIGEGAAFVQPLLQQLEAAAPAVGPENCFSFLLIDGLSRREEPVARALQDALGAITLFGGSAGDNLKLTRTWVFHDGAFHPDSAVLLLVSTRLPFKIFKTQHFVSEEERLVVTEADASQRIVREINGLPAAEEYARVIGVAVGDLNPMRFAASPVVVTIDGTDYVRSIQRVNPDGSLTFFCAIDEGLVLRVVRGVDLLGNIKRTFGTIRAEIGPFQLVLACDCILRNLEMTQSGAKDAVAELLRKNHVVGFSTYGEQYHGVHVNQTLTGIALGYPREGHAP